MQIALMQIARSARLVCGVPVLLLWLHVGLYWEHTSVDASTEACHARTLTEGGGLALQPGATRGMGVHGVLWVLALAGFQLLGLPLLLGAKLLGALLAGVALLLLPGAVARLDGRRQVEGWDRLPCWIMALHPALALHAVAGLGTSLTLLLLVLTLRLSGRWLSSVPAALLILTTLDAVPLVAGLWVGRLVHRSFKRHWVGFVDDVVWLLIPLASLLVFVLGCYLLFADPWPGVLSVRQALPETRLGSPQALALGWASLGSWCATWGLTLPLGLLALGGACVRSRGGVMAAVLGLCTLAVVAASGGDVEGHRLVPAWLCLSLLWASGLRWLVRRLPRAMPRVSLVAAGALCVGLAAGPCAAAIREALDPPPSPHQQELRLVRRLEAVIAELGWVPQQVTVLTDRPGVMAWRRFQVVDATGTTDLALRRYNGNRHPLELARLVFRQRQPQVLVERPPWRHVHGLTDYPETRRRFVGLAPESPGDPDVSLSRELILDEPPWPDRPLRLDMGHGLWLLGARILPEKVVLLWMHQDNAPAPRRMRLGNQHAWSVASSVGPSVYPLPRWRAGEVVRQGLIVPRSAARGPLWIEVQGGPRRRIDGLDLNATLQSPNEWYRRRLAPLLRADRLDDAESLVLLWDNRRIMAPRLVGRTVTRIDGLVRKGLLLQAAVQLRQARRSYLPTPDLLQVADNLARRAYGRAQDHVRWGRWPLAFAHLQLATIADPGSPWIARRLEEARARQPAEGYLVPLLELELAQRAMALAPDAARLTRLMRAQLALGQAAQAVVTYHQWGRYVRFGQRAGMRPRFLLAKALALTGRLGAALREIDALLGQVEPTSQPRRCPPWLPLQPLMLQARLRWFTQQQRMEPRPLLLEGPTPRLKGEGGLLASCVRWTPGQPVRITLHLWQPRTGDLPLEVRLGSRRQRMLVPASDVPLSRLELELWLPPASYPVALHAPEGVMDLGQITVGPEANFGFELPSYASWRRTGDAFGEVPVVGRRARWRFLAGYQGERYADSFARGFDRATGTLTSPPFLLRRSHLMFLVAGGVDPDLGLDLMVQGRRVFTARGKGDEMLRTVFVPLDGLREQWARIVIRDDSSRRFGHLAVDEIHQVDGPLPGLGPGE